MKKSKHKEWHASSDKIGMGDFYGTGVKNPIGRVRSSYISTPVSPSKLKKPPKSLA
jgi:hypothetical protein